MNKTIQLTAIITATIMIVGIIGAGFSQQAFAKKPQHLICYAQNGNFNGTSMTFDAVASCTQMGKVTIGGSYSVGNIMDSPCLSIVSLDTVPSKKKGNASVKLATDSIQCFFDANGQPISVGDISSWCGITSVLDGNYTVDSLGSTGKFEGKTGEGTIHSDAEHCGDTMITQIRGSLE